MDSLRVNAAVYGLCDLEARQRISELAEMLELDQEENVYPMIKSGQAHNEMHLSPTSKDTELA